MSGRIYSAEIFQKELERYQMGYSHCPKCFGNNLTNKEGHFLFFQDYKCLDCSNLFYKESALTRQKIRNKKIECLLKTK